MSLILSSKGQGPGAQGSLACVFSTCFRTHDEAFSTANV